MSRTIVVFRGSPRPKGNTNSLTDVVVPLLRDAGHKVLDFDLTQMDLHPCTSCRECQKDWNTVSCVQKDDFQTIAEAVCESDLMIFASPIYSWYCTPPMKTLLDRMVYAFNMYYGDTRGPSLWKGKAVALITTCGYPPEKGADLFEEGIRRYCKHSQLQYMGMICERNAGYKETFMYKARIRRAEKFAEELLQKL